MLWSSTRVAAHILSYRPTPFVCIKGRKPKRTAPLCSLRGLSRMGPRRRAGARQDKPRHGEVQLVLGEGMGREEPCLKSRLTWTASAS